MRSMVWTWSCLVAWLLAATVWAANEPAVPKRTTSLVYDAQGRRDPFVPLVKDGRLLGVAPERQAATEAPVLYGILWDPSGKSIALINDLEVKVGDDVGSYHVMEIRQDAVVLTREGGEPVILKLAFEPLTPETSSTTITGRSDP